MINQLVSLCLFLITKLVYSSFILNLNINDDDYEKKIIYIYIHKLLYVITYPEQRSNVHNKHYIHYDGYVEIFH